MFHHSIIKFYNISCIALIQSTNPVRIIIVKELIAYPESLILLNAKTYNHYYYIKYTTLSLLKYKYVYMVLIIN